MSAKPPPIRARPAGKRQAEKALGDAMAGVFAANGGLEAIPCGSNPDLWHHEAAEDRKTALAICRSCPVIDECRTYALATPAERWGVWGGLDMTEERRRAGADRVCQRCDAEYTPTHTTQLYCTRNCAAKAHRKQQHASSERLARKELAA